MMYCPASSKGLQVLLPFWSAHQSSFFKHGADALVGLSSSIKMEWGMRPSRMWTRSTPPAMASTQHSILGIMPPEMMPWATRPGTSDQPDWDQGAPRPWDWQQAPHVRQEDQLLRPHGLRQLGSGSVGVDVVGGVGVHALGHSGDHRDVAVLQGVRPPA